MSVLVVGVSHKSAPVAVLECVTLDDDGVGKLLADVMDTPHAAEAIVLSTCNRVEVYVDVDRFHGSVEDVSSLLAARAGARDEDVIPHLFVHYDEAAVAHLFSVAAGLDSMVVGESQVLGQVRLALHRAQAHNSVGPSLNALFQQALRVGKRGHAETGIDRAGRSVVDTALERARHSLGDLRHQRVLVVGAGAMAGLTVSALAARGVRDVVIANRTPRRADRLVQSVSGRAIEWRGLPTALQDVDLVVSCTGATGLVIGAAEVRRAVRDRPLERPYVVIDLAVPHDVDPAVTDLPTVERIDLAALAPELATDQSNLDVEAVRDIVTGEVTSFLAARAAARVAPTVVALRSMATEVVDRELSRLSGRLPDLDARAYDEVVETVRRVADKLLHSPTVRIKELAELPGAVSYADALADLFSLAPGTVAAVTRPDVASPGEGSR
ncbi:MAG: glutamyl-tRNA reductase [Nocardioidaceae bacterium]|nr:glutamyl-tRNA reductase [Nocardioidaceae bacterium]